MKHKNNELKLFIHKFLENQAIHSIGDQDSEIKHLTQFFNAGINLYDHPDGFCKYEDNVLIIEHFEFDSSNKNKNGSKNRQEIFRTSNVLPNDSENIQIYKDEIKCNYNIENYVNNLLSGFDKHYDEIEGYKIDLKKEQIITKYTNTEVLFCIEDATILGNIDANNGSKIFPLFCEELINKIQQSKQLDYIITGSRVGNNGFTWFTSCKNIKNYEIDKYNKDNTKIINWSPKTVVGVINIPNNWYNKISQ